MTIQKDNAVFRPNADQIAKPMFALSILFVVLLAGLISVWIDVPRVAELNSQALIATNSTASSSNVQAPEATQFVQNSKRIGGLLLYVLFAIWPIFWLEFFYTWRTDAKRTGFPLAKFLCCVIPPIRLSARCTERQGAFWLPVLHWQQPGKALSRRLRQFLSGPMLVIALLILPILLLEYTQNTLLTLPDWFRLVLHVATAFIWCAFTLEFIIMVAATDKKFSYIKQHWIDLVIIFLPLASFLRAIPALRLARIAKVQKLAKVIRVFRLRGLLMKVLRALMLFEVINRILRVTPEKQLEKLKVDYQDKASDLEELKARIEFLEQTVLQEKALFLPTN